jgi:hypothetical protein
MTSSMGMYGGGAGTSPQVAEYNQLRAERDSGVGWTTFAGVLLILLGTLNVIHGIGAVSDSKFFVGDAKFVISNLHFWGWVMIALGGLQLLAAFSVFRGGLYGRYFGILVLSVNAITSLLAIQSFPFTALCVFALDIVALYGLVAYTTRPGATAQADQSAGTTAQADQSASAIKTSST